MSDDLIMGIGSPLSPVYFDSDDDGEEQQQHHQPHHQPPPPQQQQQHHQLQQESSSSFVSEPVQRSPPPSNLHAVHRAPSPLPSQPSPHSGMAAHAAAMAHQKVLAAAQQTRALYEQQEQLKRPGTTQEIDAAGIRELEAQVREAVLSTQTPGASEKNSATLTVLYAALLAKQRGANVCSCRHARCGTCLNCSTTHCSCSRGALSSDAVPNPVPVPSAPTQPVPAAQHTLAPSPPTPTQVAQQQQHQQQQQQQQQQRRVADISEVARYYVSRQHSPNTQTFLCDPCSESTTNSPVLICDGCQRNIHVACVTKFPDHLPRGLWYCQSCFPEANHIYYPGRAGQQPLSVLEIGRVIQIVSGTSTRLPVQTQIAYVEAFLKRIPTSGMTRIFVHNKNRVQPTADVQQRQS